MESKLNFSLTQLEYVISVHKHGHFAKAATACFVTQPTLSMQIQKLEETLGVIIFDRSKKPILMTETGRKLVKQMQTIVSEAKKLDEITQGSETDKLDGELVLGIIPTISPYLVPRLLPVVAKLYPALRLQIFEMQTAKIVEALDDDEIDAGILATPIKAPQVRERPLYLEPFSVLCRKSHGFSKLKRVKYSQLSSDDIWLLEEGHCLRHQVLDVCSLRQKKSVTHHFQFQSGSLETLKNLVDSYGGYTLVPQLAAETIGRNVVIVPFERPIPAREIGLVSRRLHYKEHLLDALAQAVVQSIPESLSRARQKDLDVLPAE
ncbi:MAG: hydrogen peroxide-inducible genes activator [Bdellovibrionales bacterium]|nr:hydrogen peroxide-inducible genes activator [Bdellovibrionales bacterium]